MKLLVLIFAFFGAFTLIEKIITLIKFKDISGELIYLLRMKGHIENIEYILRKASNKMKWLQGNENKSIICIDEGMDEETLIICENCAKDNSMIKIVRSRR